MPIIELRCAEVVLELETLPTPTAKTIIAGLPYTSFAQPWGEEIYFNIPVSVDLEDDAKDIVEAGEIAFWTVGNCVAIGFGPTPISTGNEIRLADRTNIWARTTDDVRRLKSIQAGEPISMKLKE